MFTSFDYEVKALNKTKVQLINEHASHLFANIHYSGAKKLIDIQKEIFVKIGNLIFLYVMIEHIQ